MRCNVELLLLKWLLSLDYYRLVILSPFSRAIIELLRRRANLHVLNLALPRWLAFLFGLLTLCRHYIVWDILFSFVPQVPHSGVQLFKSTLITFIRLRNPLQRILLLEISQPLTVRQGEHIVQSKASLFCLFIKELEVEGVRLNLLNGELEAFLVILLCR